VIPLRLRLRNFMSYGEEGATLDFSAFRIACLCGDNGHGKSTFLDAMTWAIWGRSRARTENELVHAGSQDMQVDLAFCVAGEEYLLIRKRSLRNRGGTGALVLQQVVGDGTVPITADSMNATQDLVRRLIRMDYETFINSVFVRQGHADEFTIKTPTERKRILGTLLGLDRYDALQQRARERARELAGKRATVDRLIADADRTLSERPAHEANHARASAIRAETEQVRDTLDEQLKVLHVEFTRLEGIRAKHVEAVRARRQMEGDGERLRQERARLDATIAEVETLLARSEAIHASVAHLQKLREQNAAFDTTAAEERQLREQRERAREGVQVERGKIEAQIASRATEIEGVRAAAALLPDLERARAQHSERATALSGLRERRDALLGERYALEVERTSLVRERDDLKTTMEGQRNKVRLISQEGALCPICGGALTGGLRAHVRQQLIEEGLEMRGRSDAAEARVKAIGGDMPRLTEEIGAVDRAIAVAVEASDQVNRLDAQIDSARAARECLPTLESAIEANRGSLTREEYAPEALADLRGAESALAALAYDPHRHQQIRAEIESLVEVEREFGRLQTAAEALERDRRARDAVDASIAERAATLAEHIARMDGFARELQAVPVVEEQIADLTARRGQAQSAIDTANVALGALTQKLAQCGEAATQRTELLAESAAIGEDAALYGILEEAFGRNGIQAAIIDAARPEIEDEANRLLHRLTNGQLTLTIELQRPVLSGRATQDTLEIRVSDGASTRSYEMFSGGEAFRIDLSLRIALSRVLAQRAGADLRMLIVDEGFGTQDATGRDRIVEAFSVIAEEFDKVLVITHVDELKDAFPVRIDVCKAGGVSRIVNVSGA